MYPPAVGLGRCDGFRVAGGWWGGECSGREKSPPRLKLWRVVCSWWVDSVFLGKIGFECRKTEKVLISVKKHGCFSCFLFLE